MEHNDKDKQPSHSGESSISKSSRDFDSKLAEKLKKGNMKPKPRWRFLLKDYVIWIFGVASLLIGAAAVSVMIYFLKYNDWGFRAKTHKDLMDFIMTTLPYFWLILLAVFIFILYYNFKQTKRGYRYPMWAIIIGSILASVILGELLFLAGLGQDIDDVLGQQVPLYDKVINRQIDFWYNPARGRLVGLVSARQTDHSFNITDPKGIQWQVTIKSDSDDGNLIAPKLYQPVDMIGRASAGNNFQAIMIRVVHPGRKFILRQRHHISPLPSASACSASSDSCSVRLPSKPFSPSSMIPDRQ